MIKRVELIPADGRKSFYGKARLSHVDTRHIKSIYLTSYNTTVCALNTENGQFTRLWDGYSATTMRHVNAFRYTYGLPTLSKSKWLELPIGIPV